jgi:hypothetical protein
MHTAPAFELHVAPGWGQRTLVALIGGASAAVVAIWLWSHFDAAAGPAGRSAASWLAVGAGAALIGAGLGWRLAPRAPAALAWRQGKWLLSRSGAVAQEGDLQARLDLGNWMVLCFLPAGGGRAVWLSVDVDQAGAGWHPLRATLFAPTGRRGSRDEGTPA